MQKKDCTHLEPLPDRPFERSNTSELLEISSFASHMQHAPRLFEELSCFFCFGSVRCCTFGSYNFCCFPKTSRPLYPLFSFFGSSIFVLASPKAVGTSSSSRTSAFSQDPLEKQYPTTPTKRRPDAVRRLVGERGGGESFPGRR